MIGVIDTSALLRLFIPDGPVPEGLEIFLKETERGQSAAIAPELMVVEATNVLCKKLALRELSKAECQQMLQDVLSVPIQLFPHMPLLGRSLEIAADNGITAYDAVYLSLAETQGAVLFSADRKLVQIAKKMHLMPP